MVSHLTRAAILICVLMLICVLFLCKMSVYIMFNHYMRHVYLTVWPALHCLMIQVQHDLLFSCNFFSMLTTHVHMYFLEVTFSKLCCAPVKTFRHLSKGANGRISHIRTDKELKYVNCKNAQLLLSRWIQMTLYVSSTTNTHWLLMSIKSVSWPKYLAWLWTIALKVKEFWIYLFCLVLYTILQAQSFIVQDKKSKCRKRAGNDQSFNSHEWPRQNFSLQYQADKPQE